MRLDAPKKYIEKHGDLAAITFLRDAVEALGYRHESANEGHEVIGLLLDFTYYRNYGYWPEEADNVLEESEMEETE